MEIKSTIMTHDYETRQYFNNLAPHWENEALLQEEKIYTILKRLKLKPGESILDLGCGTGILFLFLEQLTGGRATIVGLDAAQKMAQQAARISAPHLHITCGDGQALPFSSNSFHHIIAFQVFPHIYKKLLALQECWRVLKPGGEICIFHLQGSSELNAFHASLTAPVNNHTLPPAPAMAALLTHAHFHTTTTIDQSGQYLIIATAVKNS